MSGPDNPHNRAFGGQLAVIRGYTGARALQKRAGDKKAKPHPAAKRVLSLRQNDLIAVEREGGPREIMRVVKFAGGGQITFASDNEAGALKARDAEAKDIDPFKYFYSSASGLQKAKARQIRLDELGRIFDPGARD